MNKDKVKYLRNSDTKNRQQKNHIRACALELSVMNNWWGLKLVWRCQPHPQLLTRYKHLAGSSVRMLPLSRNVEGPQIRLWTNFACKTPMQYTNDILRWKQIFIFFYAPKIIHAALYCTSLFCCKFIYTPVNIIWRSLIGSKWCEQNKSPRPTELLLGETTLHFAYRWLRYNV